MSSQSFPVKAGSSTRRSPPSLIPSNPTNTPWERSEIMYMFNEPYHQYSPGTNFLVKLT